MVAGEVAQAKFSEELRKLAWLWVGRLALFLNRLGHWMKINGANLYGHSLSKGAGDISSPQEIARKVEALKR